MIKLNKDTYAGIVVFIVSVLFLLQSVEYSYSSAIGPGPGYFPIWLSGTLLILSIVYIVQSAKGKNVSDKSWPRGKELIDVLWTIGSLCTFFVLFYFVGFIISCMIFLILLFYKKYKWYINFGISIGFTLFIYWLFKIVIGVPLPTGILF